MPRHVSAAEPSHVSWDMSVQPLLEGNQDCSGDAELIRATASGGNYWTVEQVAHVFRAATW